MATTDSIARVWKIQLAYTQGIPQDLRIPASAQLLNISRYQDTVLLWAMVNPSHESVIRRVRVTVQGELIEQEMGTVDKYIGSDFTGARPIHAFEVVREQDLPEVKAANEEDTPIIVLYKTKSYDALSDRYAHLTEILRAEAANMPGRVPRILQSADKDNFIYVLSAIVSWERVIPSTRQIGN